MPDMREVHRHSEERIRLGDLTTNDDLERNDVAYALEHEQLLPGAVHALNDAKKTTRPARRDTSFLDGLRGLAAVFVMIQHFINGFSFLAMHEYGFGEAGNYTIASLPLFRIIFNGGDMAVVVFFILSGYVLSIGPLHKIQQQKTQECRQGLISAVVRRPLRLYVPPLTISLIVALLMHVPGLSLPALFHPPLPTVAEEMKFFVTTSISYFSIFHEHGTHFFSYPYNVVLWTLPIELKGSLLVYGLLFVLSMICSGTDPRRPTIIALAIFGVSIVMLQTGWKWSMSNFLCGVALAMLDTWPIGEQIAASLRFMKTPQAVAEDMSTIGEVLAAVLVPIERQLSTLVSRILPKTVLLRFPEPKEADEPEQHTSLHTFCFLTGWYLLSQPSASGHRQHITNTPGWKTLASLIPAAYDDGHYYRYWQSWGGILFIYALLRTPWLQHFFRSRILKFCGYVSFMLYLIHLPWFRIFPDRFADLINGAPCNDMDKGGMWDVQWRGLPDWGFACMNLRSLVYIVVTWPMTFGIAYIATQYVDQPSVRLGKYVTTRLGLEKKSTSR